MDEKESKKVYDILLKHKVDVERMVDICKCYKIPYLLPAYENVLSVLVQMMSDIEDLKYLE